MKATKNRNQHEGTKRSKTTRRERIDKQLIELLAPRSAVGWQKPNAVENTRARCGAFYRIGLLPTRRRPQAGVPAGWRSP